MTSTGWHREPASRTAGPGNVLNGRFEVRRYGDALWEVLDRTTRASIAGFATMREARLAAESFAKEAT